MDKHKVYIFFGFVVFDERWLSVQFLSLSQLDMPRISSHLFIIFQVNYALLKFNVPVYSELSCRPFSHFLIRCVHQL